MESMKILLVNKYHYVKGGAERAYFDTARVLEDHGHEVAFFSMHHPMNVKTRWSKYFIDSVDYHDNPSIRQKVRIVKNILWNRQAQENLRSLIEEFQPDVAHLHNVYHQISPSIIATLKRHRVPVVMTLHDYKLICPNYSMYVRGRIWEGGALRCALDRCVQDSYSKSLVCAVESMFHQLIGIYDRVDAYIAPSQFLKEKFREHGFQKKITHIAQPLFKEDLLESVPFDVSAPILFAGRLSIEKGVETIIRAMALCPGEKLEIAGSGPEERALKELVRSLGVQERVSFLGHLLGKDLRPRIQKAKAVIITSVWFENMPYALLEALGAGKVVIASRIGGMTERIVDGENGFLFTAGDVEDLAHTIEKISPKNVEDIQYKARQSVQDISPEEYYKKVLSVYQKVVGKNKK